MRDHGMSPQKKYWHEIMGFNYRLTNMQAAIGVAQLEQLEKKVNIKIKIEGYYRKYLKKENINFIKNERFTRNSFWLNTFILNEGISREELMEMLKKNGIDSRPVFYPLSEMPPYKDALIFSSLENSINISKRGISLPSSTSLNEIDIQLISENFNNLIQKLI